jgi:hypothetical protein
MFVDYSQLQQIAVLEQQTGLWLKMQVTPLFGPLVLFSQTFPPSGILHGGKLFVPLTLGQHTTGLGFSSLPFLPTVRAAQGDPRNINVWERDPSKPQNLENALYGVVNPPLLRTPISSEAEGGAMHPEDAKAGGNNLKLGWQILGHFGHIEPKLPTPNTMEHREIKTPEQIAELKKRSPGGYRNLRESVVNDLMPTPTARDFKDGQAEHERDGVVQTDTVARAIFNSGEISLLNTPQVDDAKNTGHNQDRRQTLASEVWETERTTSWGKFEPAINRWEQVIDRPAPAPTKADGKDGQHRLSSEFTEWLMGLPDGWVTDPELGLTRNEQLKLCGNGVVPQQAALALRMMLSDFIPEKNDDAVMPTLTTNGTGRHSAGYDSLGTLQMLEVAKGILPKEYTSWEQVNAKIPAEWRDGNAGKENK